MIEPSIQFEIESGNPWLMPCMVGCNACGVELFNMVAFGIQPDLRFRCELCGSEDTERRAVPE